MLTDTTRSIADYLPLLRASAPPTGRVLSAYLDTSPHRADNDAYLLAFRDCCKEIRASLEWGELTLFERVLLQPSGRYTHPLVMRWKGADDAVHPVR
jgi:hypothetical protein